MGSNTIASSKWRMAHFCYAGIVGGQTIRLYTYDCTSQSLQWTKTSCDGATAAGECNATYQV